MRSPGYTKGAFAVYERRADRTPVEIASWWSG
jgi:hypothetical protein